MIKTNNLMHRPALMESRDARKIQIDKTIGDMLAYDRSIAIKVLNFLDKNPTNGYAILANELSNFLTKEECEKETIQELHRVSITTQTSVTTEVQHVKDQVRLIRINQLEEINDAIGVLISKKTKLLTKIGSTQDPSRTIEDVTIIEDSLVGIGTQNIEGGDHPPIQDVTGSELATIDMGFFDVGDTQAPSILTLPLHKNIPSLRISEVQFGTIQELKSAGSELAPIVEKNLARAMEMLPDVFAFTELTPAQLQKIVTDMELFASPEERKNNLIELYDYIEDIKRRGWLLGIDNDVMKKFKRMTEKKVIDDKSAMFLNSTIEQVFRYILSTGSGVHHLIERNIGTDSDILAKFVSKMNEPFISNGIPEEYQKMAPERSKNVGQIICLMRVLDRTQMIYTNRLKQIVPYYRSTTTEVLRFYTELELKFAKQNKSIKSFFHDESYKQLEGNIAFIRTVDGYMESFGRISPKQEQSLKESIFTFQQSIQSLIDAYEEFETCVTEDYKRIPGDAQSAFVEIMTRIYDRGLTKRSTQIGSTGAQRFPIIDNFVAQITHTKGGTCISQGREAVKLCIENPDLMNQESCPKSFREIVALYVQ